MAHLSPLFTWRSAIASEHGPDSSTTRHVLLTLSLHMNQKGRSCFPSLDSLAEEAGVSRKTVCNHLKKAHENGWIDKRNEYTDDGRQKKNDYYATIPGRVKEIHPRVNESKEEGERGSKEDDNIGRDTQSAHAREDGLPPHAPTEEQVVEYGTSRAGLAEEECRKFWRHYSAVGWLDPQDRKITNWKLKLGNWDASRHKYSGDGAPPDQSNDDPPPGKARTGPNGKVLRRRRN